MRPTLLRKLAVCAALAVPALASAPAHGQPVAQSGTKPPPLVPILDPTDPVAVLQKQRQIFEQANKLYDAGKLPEAEKAYLEAWKLKRSYDVAGNLGNVEADMHKWRAAAEYLTFAIREFPAGGKPALRDSMLARLTEAQKQVGRLRLKVSRPHAEVFIDGTSIGVAPLADDVYVDPGSHLVEARLDPFTPVQVTVNAVAGQTQDVDVALHAPRANRAIIMAGAVVAGAGVITGAVLLAAGIGKGSSASTLATKLQAMGGCPPAASNPTGPCGTLKSDLDAKSTLGSAGVWLLVGAGAVGVGTLAYGLAASSRASKTGLVVAPVVTANGGGLFAQGSF
jgi:hypothetical protein